MRQKERPIIKMPLILAVLIVATVACSLSCSPPKADNEYSSLVSELNNAKSQIQGLTQNMADLENDLEALQANNDKLQKDYRQLQADHKKLQEDYDRFVERVRKSSTQNISWAELQEVLIREDTDKMEYIPDKFDSQGFVLSLRDRLSRYGIRCAYVSVGFSDSDVGHALNAFETTDKGLVFVDCVGGDKIAYVEKGKPYVAISLDAVKPDYIDCEGNPAEFWGELVWKKQNNLFSYDYYDFYIKRIEFFEQSTDTYNNALEEFNRGSTKWSQEQFFNWKMNLEALQQDLGKGPTKPLGIVKSIEIYWN